MAEKTLPETYNQTLMEVYCPLRLKKPEQGLQMLKKLKKIEVLSKFLNYVMLKS